MDLRKGLCVQLPHAPLNLTARPAPPVRPLAALAVLKPQPEAFAQRVRL